MVETTTIIFSRFVLRVVNLRDKSIAKTLPLKEIPSVFQNIPVARSALLRFTGVTESSLCFLRPMSTLGRASAATRIWG